MARECGFFTPTSRIHAAFILPASVVLAWKIIERRGEATIEVRVRIEKQEIKVAQTPFYGSRRDLEGLSEYWNTHRPLYFRLEQFIRHEQDGGERVHLLLDLQFIVSVDPVEEHPSYIQGPMTDLMGNSKPAAHRRMVGIHHDDIPQCRPRHDLLYRSRQY